MVHGIYYIIYREIIYMLYITLCILHYIYGESNENHKLYTGYILPCRYYITYIERKKKRTKHQTIFILYITLCMLQYIYREKRKTLIYIHIIYYIIFVTLYIYMFI